MTGKGKVNLSDDEWKIVNLLQEGPSQMIMDLIKALKDDKGRSKNTVITMLNHVEAEGAVHYEERERVKLFYPAVDRANAALQEARGLLGRVYEESVSLTVDAMASSKSLPKQEIEELYETLRKVEEGAPWQRS